MGQTLASHGPNLPGKSAIGSQSYLGLISIQQTVSDIFVDVGSIKNEKEIFQVGGIINGIMIFIVGLNRIYRCVIGLFTHKTNTSPKDKLDWNYIVIYCTSYKILRFSLVYKDELF